MKGWGILALAILFPVADVGTLFLLARWIGTPATLGLLAVSTALGLVACRTLGRRILDHDRKYRETGIDNVPGDVLLIQGGEAFLGTIVMLCFLFPGFLSDAVGLALVLPRIQKRFMGQLMTVVQKQAAREGKTVEAYIREGHPSRNRV